MDPIGVLRRSCQAGAKLTHRGRPQLRLSGHVGRPIIYKTAMKRCMKSADGRVDRFSEVSRICANAAGIYSDKGTLCSGQLDIPRPTLTGMADHRGKAQTLRRSRVKKQVLLWLVAVVSRAVAHSRVAAGRRAFTRVHDTAIQELSAIVRSQCPTILHSSGCSASPIF